MWYSTSPKFVKTPARSMGFFEVWGAFKLTSVVNLLCSLLLSTLKHDSVVVYQVSCPVSLLDPQFLASPTELPLQSDSGVVSE